MTDLCAFGLHEACQDRDGVKELLGIVCGCPCHNGALETPARARSPR